MGYNGYVFSQFHITFIFYYSFLFFLFLPVPSTLRLPSIKETKNDQMAYSFKSSRSSTKSSSATGSSKGFSKILPETKKSTPSRYTTATTTAAATSTSSTTRIYATMTKEPSLRTIKSEENSVNHSFFNNSTASFRHCKLAPSSSNSSSQRYLIKSTDPSSIAPSPSGNTEHRRNDNSGVNGGSKVLPVEGDVGMSNRLTRFSLLDTGSQSSYQCQSSSQNINTMLPSPISPKSPKKVTSIFSRLANIGHFPVPFHTKK